MFLKLHDSVLNWSSVFYVNNYTAPILLDFQAVSAESEYKCHNHRIHNMTITIETAANYFPSKLLRTLSFSLSKIICLWAWSMIHYFFSAFKIRLSTQKLPKLLPTEICIFSNVRQQIIAEACLNNSHINFWINHCKK